jgi:hypothetical protein
VPASAREKVTFRFLDHVDQAAETALSDPFASPVPPAYGEGEMLDSALV